VLASWGQRSAPIDTSQNVFFHILQANAAIGLSPGRYTTKNSQALNRKRTWCKQRESTKDHKRRRLFLKGCRKKKAAAMGVREGDTYQTDVDLLQDTPDIQEIPKSKLVGDGPKVFFDLETTGLSNSKQIVQIAAVSGDREFNKYVLPTVPMSREASAVTGIDVRNNCVYHKGKVVPSVSLSEAMTDFITFLADVNCGGKQPTVYGHNIASFDVPLLHKSLQKVQGNSLLPVVGFVDTRNIARKVLKKGSVINYKQQTLVTTLLKEDYDAHNALGDVIALQKLHNQKLEPDVTQDILNDNLFQIDSYALKKSLHPLCQNKVVSQLLIGKMGKSGLGMEHLKLAFTRGGAEGLQTILKEPCFKNHPRVSNKKVTLDKIVQFVSNIHATV
jgi:DNA polymerase III epsilon subunit-like protein